MKKFANLYLALVFVILYLPIFYLIAYSFNSGGDMNSFTGFTLDNYQSMFSDSRLMLILAQTFFLAFLVLFWRRLLVPLGLSLSMRANRSSRLESYP